MRKVKVDWNQYRNWYQSNTIGGWVFNQNLPVQELPISNGEQSEFIKHYGEPYCYIEQSGIFANVPSRFVTYD